MDPQPGLERARSAADEPSGVAARISPSDVGDGLARTQEVRFRNRQRRVLLATAGAFAAYYASFYALDIYGGEALLVGLVMAAAMVCCAVCLPGVSRQRGRGLGVLLAVVLGGGAVTSAAASHGSQCVGFHAIWALPLIYGLLLPQETAGAVVVTVLGLAGGVGILAHDGESLARVLQWSALAVSAGVFALAHGAVSRRESAQRFAETRGAFEALLLAEAHRAEENEVLARTLQERTAELAAANERLGASLTRLESAQAELVRAGRMEAIARLSGGVAHEFNNLLGVIVGTTSLVLEELPRGTREAEELHDVVRAAEQAATITRQLLALSSRQVQRVETFDLADAARDVLRMLRRAVGDQVTTTLHVPDPAFARADRAQVQQLLLNLAVHARDRMPGGGAITIRVRLADESDLATAPGATGDFVVLEVADTGPELDAAARERIFEPVFSTREVGNGAELGLAVAYGIVSQSGGHIACDSPPGEGTRFTILLPAADAATVAHRPPSVSASLGPPRGVGTVLVAEDEEAIRRMVARVLRAQGFTVLEARDGAEALDVADRHEGPIDLLLTDLGMPHVGGVELARRLTVGHPETRVTFMSGYGHEMAEALKGWPGAPCLDKPFTPPALRRFVVSNLPGALTSLPG